MKSDYIFKHIQLMLWGIVVAFVIHIVFSAEQASAQSLDQQTSTIPLAPILQTDNPTIQQLSAALALIADAIQASSDITELERLTLITQLIQVSQAVSGLQQALIAQTVGDAAGGSDQQDTSIADIGIYRFVAEIDLDDEDAKVSSYYHTDTPKIYRKTTQTLDFDTPDESGTYAKRISDIENDIAAQIASAEELPQAEVKGYMFVSAYNPDRTERYNKNSTEAYILASDFGRRSLATSIALQPGEDVAKMTVYSDQSERLEFEIERKQNAELKNGEVVYTDFDFTVTASLYLVDIDDYELPRGSDSLFPATVTFTEKDLTEKEVLGVIQQSLSVVPFADQFEDIEERFLAFMTQNEAVFEYGKRRTPDSAQFAQCVDSGDKAIIDEYVLSLAQSMRLQFIDEPGFITYEFPDRHDADQASQYDGCRSVMSFF